MPDLETAARTVWKDETAELNALKGSLKVVEAQVKIDKVPAFSSSMGAFAKVTIHYTLYPSRHRPRCVRSHAPLTFSLRVNGPLTSRVRCFASPQGRGREARQGAGGA